MAKKKYPEHERLAKVKVESQAIGAFINWLHENDRIISIRHEHDSRCISKGGMFNCDYRRNELQPEIISIEQRLAKYFRINLNKLDKEKEQMLEEFRANTRNRSA